MPILKSSHERDLFTYLESYCVRVQFPIRMKLGADWDISVWDTGKFFHTLNYYKLLKIK